MSQSPECPCGRPRAGCEYHDPAPQAPIRISVPPGTKLPTSADFAREWAAKHGLRLLGPDDPEVSNDLIYLNDATGGVVGVPTVRITVTLPGAIERVCVEGAFSI